MGELKDITVEILTSIRDEIRSLRADTNLRFEQMDKRFEQMDKRFEQMDKRFEQMDKRFELMNERLLHIETDISQMKVDMKAIATHFERNYLLLANEVGVIKGRLVVCEGKLGI
jgi:predicted  nucleic acid-binding Zn-ribbon protein